MSESTERIFLVLIIIQLTFGMMGNGFIVLVNGRSWFTSKRISLSDFIITSLAVSRVIELWIFLVDVLLMLLPSNLYNEEKAGSILKVFWTFTHHMCLWLVTCLSVLYCLKVASFSHPAFLWFKWRVSQVVMWMLSGALLLSCVNAISWTEEFKISSLFFEIESKWNTTESPQMTGQYGFIHILRTLWNLPPLVVCLISCFLLTLSLGKHTRQMQQYGAKSRDPTTEAHQKAIKIIFYFIFLFLLFFFVLLISSFRHLLPGTRVIKMFGEVIMTFCFAGHSCILILGNTKLKQTLVQILRDLPGCLKRGPQRTISP